MTYQKLDLKSALPLLLIAVLAVVTDGAEADGLRVGGAIRANYTVGDYSQTSATSATRGGAGTVALDTLRVNLDYRRGSWLGKAEYRFYPGYGSNNADSYHFIHTLWLGYDFGNGDQLRAGLNRAPFGPGPYGVSQSWFFDQHFYVGLADNMNVGLRYTRDRDDGWKLDLAWYAVATPTGGGNNFGRQSVRYGYDVVDETGAGYEESHQINARVLHATRVGAVDAELGASAQYGILHSNGPQSDGYMWAASLHSTVTWQQLRLALQLTRYHYAVDYRDASGGAVTRELVTMGAYDFPTEVAAKAWIPALSLSYRLDTNSLGWLDYLIPYLEFSSLIKDAHGFNNSNLWVIGAAWAKGGWYIYTDLAYSNGNDFVGNREVSAPSYFATTGGFTGQLGANPQDSWQYRFNINFGYYF